MIRKVKFPLDMGNDVKVISIEDLQENYNAEKVTEYFLNGKLLTWLKDRYYDAEAEQVKALMEHQDDKELGVKLGKIFGVEVESGIDVEMLKIRKERLEKLRDITSDDDAIHNIDLVAFDQEELGELLDEGKEVIYLCGDKFRIPLSVKNKKYIGVNSPVISFGGNGGINLEENGIVIENCEFSDNARERMNSRKSRAKSTTAPVSKTKQNKSSPQGSVKKPASKAKSTAEPVSKTKQNKSSPQGSANKKASEPEYIDCGWYLAKKEGHSLSVIVPEGVKTIPSRAFMNEKVKSVVLPSSLATIEFGAFAYTKLKSIKIPDSVTTIEYWIFEGTNARIYYRGREYTPETFEKYVAGKRRYY